jgi:hypothetical protein
MFKILDPLLGFYQLVSHSTWWTELVFSSNTHFIFYACPNSQLHGQSVQKKKELASSTSRPLPSFLRPTAASPPSYIIVQLPARSVQPEPRLLEVEEAGTTWGGEGAGARSGVEDPSRKPATEPAVRAQEAEKAHMRSRRRAVHRRPGGQSSGAHELDRRPLLSSRRMPSWRYRARRHRRCMTWAATSERVRVATLSASVRSWFLGPRALSLSFRLLSITRYFRRGRELDLGSV